MKSSNGGPDLNRFGSLFRRFWSNPLANGFELDGPDRVLKHREIIQSNPVLRANYLAWYRELIPSYEATSHLKGSAYEIGSGAGLIEEVLPDVIKTDIVTNPFVSKQMSAERLEMADDSARAVFMVSVLHHLAQPEKFLGESERALMPGGRLVLVEPSTSFPQKVLCRLLNHYEFFDTQIREWKNEEADVMSRANLALPWVIFVRDREKFHAKFPRLRILEVRYHSLFIHLLSGGMSFRPMAPRQSIHFMSALEKALSPAMKYIGTTMTIEIEKLAE